MIKFDVEKLEAVLKEIDPLIRLHWEEIAVDKDRIPLDPDWDSYDALENSGNLVIITVRDDGKLVGYSFWFLRKHLHYKQTLWAYNDVVFLHREYRNLGAGSGLLSFSERLLKDMGVQKIQYHIKTTNDWSAVLKRRGYQAEDIVVGKYIGE